MQINDTQSSRLPVLSGVPQGTVLGPLLFLIFINDLTDSVSHSTVSLFADDTKLLLDVAESNSSVLQSDLSAISQWCTQWELTLNLDKCSLIRFSLSHLNSDTSYLIDNHAISISQEVPDLGIIVNNKLSFSPHYKSICSKAYKTLFMVRRTLRLTSAPVSIKKQIYLTLVRSKLTYCCQLWRPYLIKDITMLENVQRRATKFITSDNESDYKSRLLKLDLLPLMHWYELQDLLFLIKCLTTSMYMIMLNLLAQEPVEAIVHFNTTIHGLLLLGTFSSTVWYVYGMLFNLSTLICLSTPSNITSLKLCGIDLSETLTLPIYVHTIVSVPVPSAT